MTENTNEIDLDFVLSKIGDFGKYQIIQYCILSIPIFLVGATSLSYVFSAGNLEYRCRISECENDPAIYNMPWLSSAVPFRNSEYSKCSHYGFKENVSDVLECSNYSFNQSIEIKCNSSNLIYVNDEVTIVNEFDVTCEENEWKLALVGTMNSLAGAVCMPIAGYFSDRFGRKFILMFSLINTTIFGLLRSFSLNYWMFLCCEILDIGLSIACYEAIFIYGMEILSPKQRVLGATIITAAYTLGEAMLGVIAMYTRNFRTMLLIVYAPIISMISYFWILPESIRWLSVNGKYDKVVDTIHKIIRINKVQVTDELIQPLNNIREKSGTSMAKTSGDEMDVTIQRESILAIFKSPFLLIRLLNSCFCWLTNYLVYYGLSLNSVTLAGDKYINYILSCLIEIPGFMLCYFVLDRYGRRWSLCISLIVSGLACILSEFILTSQAVTLILFLIGKCAITFSFSTIYIYTTELFPTNLRHSLLAISSAFGGIGSMIAPLTPILNISAFLLFGCTSLVAGFASLKFPETLNTKLPDTIEEARNLRKIN